MKDPLAVAPDELRTFPTFADEGRLVILGARDCLKCDHSILSSVLVSGLLQLLFDDGRSEWIFKVDDHFEPPDRD